MIKSIRYVLHENITNLFRIYSIAKYEILADFSDSKLGMFWNVINPVVQVLTYWLVFGVIMPGRTEQDGVNYICWLLGGIVVWFFIQPCITNGANAIFVKREIITKMKFPISILPATTIAKEFFNHICLMCILIPLLMMFGFMPNIHWLGLIYYMICAIAFSISLSLVTSVLNMLARDVRNAIIASMRLIMYLTPIVWSPSKLNSQPLLRLIMIFNPIDYLVQGYRDCFFFHEGILANSTQMIVFWTMTIVLFVVGSMMTYKFKTKFIDLL